MTGNGTHMASMKIVQFSRPSSPVHLCPKFFHPLDLGHPMSNEASPVQMISCMQTEEAKTKTKPSHVTFKLTTCSVVRFSPQTIH